MLLACHKVGCPMYHVNRSGRPPVLLNIQQCIEMGGWVSGVCLALLY